MYFDLEDHHPDISPVGRAISWREGILISIICHMAMVIFILVAPKYFNFGPHLPSQAVVERVQAMAAQSPRFVFVQPRVERPAPRAPERAELSDRDRLAMAPERAAKPANPLPFSRGNTLEQVDQLQQRQAARGRGPQPDPAQGQSQPQTAPDAGSTLPKFADAPSALLVPQNTRPGAQSGAAGKSPTAGGSLGDALRNLQRYTQGEAFNNPDGGGGQFGPEIQFDTKGVEFGPWIRRFIAQVKRNWFIPYAAMTMKGHVVVTFNVHKDGSITDISVVGPCPVDAFNNAAYGALVGSNPTQPLPPEYPSEKAFFTVTFFYNESPR